MKRILVTALLVLAGTFAANAAVNILGSAAKSYTIVYSATAEPEMGIDAAQKLGDAIFNATSIRLAVCNDSTKANSREILLGTTNRKESATAPALFDYSIRAAGRKLAVNAGGCWALDKACELLAADIKAGKVKSGYKLNGTVQGEFLFPREECVNLRILDDNIWLYDKPESPKQWLDAGQECTNAHRAPQFAQLIRAYMPDVIGFQECSMPMRDYLNPLISDWGYSEAWKVPEGENDDTPVYINANTVKLVESGHLLYTPAKWSNHNSKSFTWACCELKSNGKRFILLSTHLWWKGDKVQKGSTQARAAQVRLIMAEVEDLKAKYNCPIFVVGDMNCWEASMPMQQFIQGGYLPCDKIATVWSDPFKGHHHCAPATVGDRTNCDHPRSEAIDHCFLYNGGPTEVRSFKCETAWFTILLTDHCPNIIDAVL